MVIVVRVTLGCVLVVRGNGDDGIGMHHHGVQPGVRRTGPNPLNRGSDGVEYRRIADLFDYDPEIQLAVRGPVNLRQRRRL